MDPVDRLFNRVASEDYALTEEFFRFKMLCVEDIKRMKLKEGDADQVRLIADSVFHEIMTHRDYDMENIYTYDSALGSPMVEVFENCSHDRWQRDENVAVVVLTNDKSEFEKNLRANQQFVQDLASGEMMKKDLRKKISKVVEGVGADGAANMQGVAGGTGGESAVGKNEPGAKELPVDKFPAGVGSFIGGQAVGIRWTDGELVIPNAHVTLRQMFGPYERDWVEVLRLSLLLKLRSLLVKRRPDVTISVVDVLKKRRKGEKKATLFKLEGKIFPREQKAAVVLQKMPNTVEGIVKDIQAGVGKGLESVGSAGQSAEGGSGGAAESDAGMAGAADDSEGEAESSEARQIRLHEVTGHRRVLPAGFFATEQAVQRARALGVELAHTTGIDGIVRYTETYVQTHQRGGVGQVNDREGKFKG
jgi:hypothetical protein